MTRGEMICALFLLVALPGAALAGLYPGGVRGPTGALLPAVPGGNPAQGFAHPKVVSPPRMPGPGGTQVTATGIVRSAAGVHAVGGPAHIVPGVISGSGTTPRHP